MTTVQTADLSSAEAELRELGFEISVVEFWPDAAVPTGPTTEDGCGSTSQSACTGC